MKTIANKMTSHRQLTKRGSPMVPKPSKPLKAKLAPGHPFFALIEDAYRVFANPKPARIGVCERGCCMGDKIRADFFNPPIAELPLHYVRDWYFAAYDTGGVPRETWVYLLPRILEILASGEDIAAVGLEVSLERFDTGNAEKWSAREWQILDAFQRRYLRRNIEEGKDPLDDVLCMFALAGWPVPALLEQVAATPDEVLARKLWRDWCDGRVPGRESIWITAFWKSPGNSTVFDFYASPILRDRMEALTLDETTAADLVAKASAVVQVIEANTASGGC